MRTFRLQNKGSVYDILASSSDISNCPVKYSIYVENRKIILTSENLGKNRESKKADHRWATKTRQPPALTILYMYYTGGTEMPQSHT